MTLNDVIKENEELKRENETLKKKIDVLMRALKIAGGTENEDLSSIISKLKSFDENT
jgi:cell division septum initiation protein DivIVA